MPLFAKNLRLFFGPEATSVWGAYREQERASRSIEVYELVIDDLKEDLAQEQNQRGSLIRNRSNHVTDSREQLEKKEQEHQQFHKEIVEVESELSSFVNRLSIMVKSWFSDSPSVEKRFEDLEEKRRQLNKIDDLVLKARKEYGQAVYRQSAAVDPIQDLEFAISRLETEIYQCQARIALAESQIFEKITTVCCRSLPIHLEFLFMNGLQVKDAMVFTELYLDIHDGLKNKPVKKVELPIQHEDNFFEVIAEGFGRKTINVSGNIPLKGIGSHHRKVSDSDNNSRWKVYNVEFNGKVSTSFKLHQQNWLTAAGVKALAGRLENSFKKARETQLEIIQKEKSAVEKTLVQCRELFSQMIV